MCETRPDKMIFPILRAFFQHRQKSNFIYNENGRIRRPLVESLARGDEVRQEHSTIIPKFAMVKYTSGVFSGGKEQEYKILNDNEFLGFMMKRQNDTAWQQICHISAIICENDDSWKVFRFKFIFDDYYEDALFLEAKNYIKDLLDDYNLDLIKADREKGIAMMEIDPLKYVKYLSFKIVWFLEMALRIRLSKAMFEYSRDSKGNYWLYNCQNIQYRSSLDKNYDRFIYKKINLRDEEFKRVDLADVYNEKVYWDPKRRQEIESKRLQLHEIYENIKKEIDLDIYYEPPKCTKSDEVFARFHPDLNAKLSEALERTCDLDGFMKHLIQNYDPKEVKKKKLQVENEYMEYMKTQQPDDFPEENFLYGSQASGHTYGNYGSHKDLFHENQFNNKIEDDHQACYKASTFRIKSGVPPLKSLSYKDPYDKDKLQRKRILLGKLKGTDEFGQKKTTCYNKNSQNKWQQIQYWKSLKTLKQKHTPGSSTGGASHNITAVSYQGRLVGNQKPKNNLVVNSILSHGDDREWINRMDRASLKELAARQNKEKDFDMSQVMRNPLDFGYTAEQPKRPETSRMPVTSSTKPR